MATEGVEAGPGGRVRAALWCSLSRNALVGWAASATLIIKSCLAAFSREYLLQGLHDIAVLPILVTLCGSPYVESIHCRNAEAASVR